MGAAIVTSSTGPGGPGHSGDRVGDEVPSTARCLTRPSSRSKHLKRFRCGSQPLQEGWAGWFDQSKELRCFTSPGPQGRKRGKCREDLATGLRSGHQSPPGKYRTRERPASAPRTGEVTPEGPRNLGRKPNPQGRGNSLRGFIRDLVETSGWVGRKSNSGGRQQAIGAAGDRGTRNRKRPEEPDEVVCLLQKATRAHHVESAPVVTANRKVERGIGELRGEEGSTHPTKQTRFGT